MTRCIIAMLVSMFCFAATGAVRASSGAEQEILQLILVVEDSQCEFERNGTRYNSEDAADHLRLKYNNGRRYADTADHFIERLASQSSFSGKPYFIQCQDKPKEPSASWLKRALAEMRESGK